MLPYQPIFRLGSRSVYFVVATTLDAELKKVLCPTTLPSKNPKTCYKVVTTTIVTYSVYNIGIQNYIYKMVQTRHVLLLQTFDMDHTPKPGLPKIFTSPPDAMDT